MRREDDGRFAPRWRAILEARWRIRLQEVTELSMAYHGAASGGAEDGDARRLLRRAVAAPEARYCAGCSDTVFGAVAPAAGAARVPAARR